MKISDIGSDSVLWSEGEVKVHLNPKTGIETRYGVVEEREELDLSGKSWQSLKKMVIERGGKWTNVKEARAFLSK